MEILYGARLARFDLLRPIAALASKITKWDTICDRMLHRLVCYINSSLDYKLKGDIGYSSEDLNLTLCIDADFAGCLDTAKFTPGVFIALTGPNSFFPLNAISKKQSCVFHVHLKLRLSQLIWRLEQKAYRPYNYGIWF